MLTMLSWNTTYRCNLTCSHCYTSATSNRHVDELSTTEGINFIESLRIFSGLISVFSGGEPLSRPDIHTLIQNYFDILVPTNSGSLTFKIAATDNSGLTSETETYTIIFENAEATPPTDPLLVITALLGLSIGGALVVYLFLRKTGRWPKSGTNVNIGTNGDE